ncbi:MAG: hypothetical protein R3C59_16315 [Planctomycetaceae bacterium]
MVRSSTTESATLPVGVQELIDRLKADGIAEGQRQADHLIDQARQQALKIVDEAQAEADRIVAKAHEESRNIIDHGRQDLQLASRDTLLTLKESFQTEFRHRFRRLVRERLEDRQFLEKLILEIAHREFPADSTGAMKILLPADRVEIEELSGSIENAATDSLAAFVLGLSGDLLREGLTFGVSDTQDSGLRVQLVDDDVELEFTDETLTGLLMQFVAPRFRMLLDHGREGHA